jgi:hypothetical protein
MRQPALTTHVPHLVLHPQVSTPAEAAEMVWQSAAPELQLSAAQSSHCQSEEGLPVLLLLRALAAVSPALSPALSERWQKQWLAHSSLAHSSLAQSMAQDSAQFPHIADSDS